MEPHAEQPIVHAGASLEGAAGALILLHGRGASAEDILGLGQTVAPPGWAMLAPRAAGNTWYPYSFLAPRAQNEPYLGSALARVQASLDRASDAGVAAQKIVFAGFSQGACLASEFVGRHPQRYGALVAFTGGLIGPLDAPLTLAGDLAGMPALLCSGDPDPHVPWTRVEQTASLLKQLGAVVSLHRYPGRSHMVSGVEAELARTLLASV